jgi:hypothetical protein
MQQDAARRVLVQRIGQEPQILFGTPHIMASSAILATHSEYVRTYGLRVLVFSLILLVFFGGGGIAAF